MLLAARLLGCEGDGNAGVIVVSAYMGDTRGSGVLASAGDVLEMSVVRGVGGVCDMCMCLAWDRAGGVGGGRIGFGLYQFWRNMGKVVDVSVLVVVVRVGGWLGLGWCYVCVCCESGLAVLMAGPSICIVC